MAHGIDWFCKTNLLKIHKCTSVETQTDGQESLHESSILSWWSPVIFFFFLSWNWFWNPYVLQALLTDCKAIGLYQQDDGCPAESKGDGRMPSVWVKTPTELWHIRRISNMEIGTGEFQKSPQVLRWSQALDIAIKKRDFDLLMSLCWIFDQTIMIFLNWGIFCCQEFDLTNQLI